jgi:predicted DNA-binding ribbon-helix-helix protein
MLSDVEVLEFVIQGYEQLKVIAEERNLSMDDLIIEIRERLRSLKSNDGFGSVRIKEVKELTELDSEENSNFIPIYRERKRLRAGMIRIKVR